MRNNTYKLPLISIVQIAYSQSEEFQADYHH